MCGCWWMGVVLIISNACVHLQFCCIPWRMTPCVLVSGEQMDSATSLLLSSVLLAEVWHHCATGHGNQKGVMSSPQDLPTLSGQHLPHLQSVAARRSAPQGLLEKAEGEYCCKSDSCRLSGRSQPVVATSATPACCLTGDNRRCGMGVWWAMLYSVCVHVSECVLVCASNLCMSFG